MYCHISFYIHIGICIWLQVGSSSSNANADTVAMLFMSFCFPLHGTCC